MAENKTRATGLSVSAFLGKVKDERQRADSKELVGMFRELTGAPAKMWGPSIVGFGQYHYVYDSGREGDAPLIGFSPRKGEIVIYLMCGGAAGKLLSKLGKHRASKSCVYIRSLDDVDRGVLKKVAAASIAGLRKQYPG
jgi:hypothetical protein